MGGVMKLFLKILLIVIVALVVAKIFKLPALDWVAWLFNGVAFVFSQLGGFCSMLQKLFSLGLFR